MRLAHERSTQNDRQLAICVTDVNVICQYHRSNRTDNNVMFQWQWQHSIPNVMYAVVAGSVVAKSNLLYRLTSSRTGCTLITRIGTKISVISMISWY